MYVLWWDKPYGVERRDLAVGTTNRPIIRNSTILEIRHVREAQLLLTKRAEHEEFLGFVFFNPTELKMILAFLTKFNNISSSIGGKIACYLSGKLFSAFHILAWNWEFPSIPVRMIWRVFAVTATGANPVIFFLLVLYVPHKARDRLDTIVICFMYLLFLLYSIARVGLVVLIFYCLSSMPVDVYKTVEWTKFLPHFA